jgi:hypothetical protein
MVTIIIATMVMPATAMMPAATSIFPEHTKLDGYTQQFRTFVFLFHLQDPCKKKGFLVSDPNPRHHDILILGKIQHKKPLNITFSWGVFLGKFSKQSPANRLRGFGR